ncbi:MAG: hypothetical protein IJI25_11090 [Eubacterium sp.]|nr:hypothetical protein [Eubacterium sp.]
MKRTWDQEKEYRKRRSSVLAAEMDKAIEAADKERFCKAYTTAMNYMNKSERSAYMKRFLAEMTRRA